MKSLYILILGILALPLCAEDLFNAKIYPENSPNTLAYTHNNTFTQLGDSSIIDHFYYTPKGELYVRDRVILFQNEPVFNSLEFYQIAEYSSLKKEGDQVILSYERANKKKEVIRKLNTPLVFAPTQQGAISENLDKLLKGESVSFYIFAAEVLRLVKMKVSLVEDSPYAQEECVVLQMKPNNIFIDWFVDEVFYVVHKKSRRIVEMHGFSTLRLNIDGNWEFQDMDFYYTY